MSAMTQDRPGLEQDSFAATLIETAGAPYNLTVSGNATGDYRVEGVQLVRAPHQHGPAGRLVLDVVATFGSAANPHPEIEKVFPLQYKEEPAHRRYKQVEIVNGGQRFTMNVIAAL